MQGLEQGICVRVENIRLEAAVLRVIVEAKVEVLDTELGVLDLDLAVVLGHLARSDLLSVCCVRCTR